MTSTIQAKADYVVEVGTSDGWKYRKWNSGKVEAWKAYSFSSATPIAWASPVKYMDKVITFPNGLFSSAPILTATSTSSQGWVCMASASSATAGALRIATVATSAFAITVDIYAWAN